ncbi:MAG: serine/threonine protein kinase [Blastopirellula sp.]|nr:serine/threonine protein kinase [Blastopirellula sp.]
MNAEDASATWDVLIQCAEDFVAAWEADDEVPSLADIVPQEPLVTRRLALGELIKIDLEYRWNRQAYKRIEDYVAEFPELRDDSGVPCDLICEEYQIRKVSGEDVKPAEYCDRFPDEWPQVERLLGIQSVAATVTLHARQQACQLEVGETIDDFDLLIKLGSGAFATVFLARQRSLQRLVALKVAANQADEPQTLAQLDHPHIVRVFDERILPERGLHLLYMQYVAGGTLQEVIRGAQEVEPEQRSGRLFLDVLAAGLSRRGEIVPHDTAFQRQLRHAGWAEVVCRVGAGLAEALAYANARDVLHRDVKPANVLLAADGTPKLADFNVSYSAEVVGATADAYFGGSLAYMSPEQLQACNPQHSQAAADLDGRSDLYSLSILLWEMLEGVRPFQDEVLPAGWTATVEAMTSSRLEEQPRLAEKTASDALTEHVREVLTRGMAPNKQDRFSDGLKMARALLMCLHPHTLYLLSPRPDWRSVLRRFPLFSVLLAIVIPQSVAAIFNAFYNYHEIIAQLSQQHQDSFFGAVNLVNAVVFPCGMIILLLFGLPLHSALADLRGGKPTSVAKAKRRAFGYGDMASGLGITLWLVAGLAFPIVLQVIEGGVSLQVFGHFCVSMLLCGLIGSAYPFLGTTFLMTRVFLPTLMRGEEPAETDIGDLHRLRWWAGAHLLVAGAVPMFGLALIIASSFFEQSSFDFMFRVSLLFLSIAGFAGFAGAFTLHRLIQTDVDALLVAVQPLESGEPAR